MKRFLVGVFAGITHSVLGAGRTSSSRAKRFVHPEVVVRLIKDHSHKNKNRLLPGAPFILFFFFSSLPPPPP